MQNKVTKIMSKKKTKYTHLLMNDKYIRNIFNYYTEKKTFTFIFLFYDF